MSDLPPKREDQPMCADGAQPVDTSSRRQGSRLALRVFVLR